MKQKKKNSWSYYAIILIFISITLLVYGLFLNVNNDRQLFDPVDEVTKLEEEDNTISITTVDGEEVVPGDKGTNIKDKDKNKEDSSKNNKDDNKVDDKNSDKDSNKNNTPPPVVTEKPHSNSQGNNANTQPPVDNGIYIPTIDETNNNLRNSIQNEYGITIKYGMETFGYEVGGFSTTPVENSTTINAALNRLKNALALYPKGFFMEMRNGGIPLTVILVNSYEDNTITGVTDSSYSYANISIALMHPFEDSFYHESYHYIERYIFKKHGNYNSWSLLNPPGFKYGVIRNDYSYQNTFNEAAPFVNNYAQSSEAEDRASTFEYMMANTKASCLNQENTVWKKANLLKNTIETVFNTVNPGIIEYWERFL